MVCWCPICKEASSNFNDELLAMHLFRDAKSLLSQASWTLYGFWGKVRHSESVVRVNKCTQGKEHTSYRTECQLRPSETVRCLTPVSPTGCSTVSDIYGNVLYWPVL